MVGSFGGSVCRVYVCGRGSVVAPLSVTEGDGTSAAMPTTNDATIAIENTRNMVLTVTVYGPLVLFRTACRNLILATLDVVAYCFESPQRQAHAKKESGCKTAFPRQGTAKVIRDRMHHSLWWFDDADAVRNVMRRDAIRMNACIVESMHVNDTMPKQRHLQLQQAVGVSCCNSSGFWSHRCYTDYFM